MSQPNLYKPLPIICLIISISVLTQKVVLQAEDRVEDPLKKLSEQIFAGQQAESQRDFPAAIKAYSVALKEAAAQEQTELMKKQQAGLHLRRGSVYFFNNQITESIADFDAYAKAYPSRAPHLWQRGLAYYYAKAYAKGVKQFEIHEDVNAQDVENDVWHMICLAKIKGFDKAQQQLMRNKGGDARVPMDQIHDLFSGKADPDDVIAAAKKDPANNAQLRNRLCYAHLYIGLFYEARGDTQNAAKHMKIAATTYSMDHYMGELARVHWKRMSQEKQQPASQ